MARAFERPAVIALPDDVGEGLALEGLFVPVEPARAGGAVVAAPHPQMGGSMESPVVTELAHACQRSGRTSLRFNWRGIGASGGQPSGDPHDADIDFASAARFLRDSVPGPWLAAGYSFGALAALRASRAESPPESLVLVAPPTSMLDADALAGFAGETLVIAGRDDAWVDARALSELAIELPRVRVEVLPRCDHFFMASLGDVSRIAFEWLGERA